MKILVSACLLGQNCKYNGGNNYSERLAEFLQGHEIFAVCPEVMGGLPVPRVPCEIVGGVVTGKNGVSYDLEFRAGAALALEVAKKEQVDLAILQSRSPSCGVCEVYDGTFSGTLVPGKGIFAALLEENGIEAKDISEI